MNKRPFLASVLFTGLSVDGVLEMFAKSQPQGETQGSDSDERWTSYDPGTIRAEFRNLVPQVIGEGRRQLQQTSAKGKPQENEASRGVLRLR